MRISDDTLAIILHWTWGFFQNFCGLCAAIIFRQKNWHRYKNAIVTHYRSNSKMRRKGYFACGMWIFTDPELPEETYNKILSHEYGHTVQSMILGPFFPLLVGLPSMLGFHLFTYRKKHPKPMKSDASAGKTRLYSSHYPEAQANRIGEKKTGMKAIDW